MLDGHEPKNDRRKGFSLACKLLVIVLGVNHLGDLDHAVVDNIGAKVEDGSQIAVVLLVEVLLVRETTHPLLVVMASADKTSLHAVLLVIAHFRPRTNVRHRCNVAIDYHHVLIEQDGPLIGTEAAILTDQQALILPLPKRRSLAVTTNHPVTA